MSESPRVAYWFLWADDDGVSHQELCTFEKFELKPIQTGAAAQWQGRKINGPMTTMITVLPVGWLGDWHENPKPQWIIPLSGRWFVEAMDGTRAEMGPGEIAFGGDQGCRLVDGKRGHKSGTVGEEPAVLMIIQLDGTSDRIPPCGFR